MKPIEEFKSVRKLRINHTALTGKVSSRSNGRQITFESSLERDFIEIADFNPEVHSIVEQPVTIEYDCKGTIKSYTPDFLVFYKINKKDLQTLSPLLIEIKYRAGIKKDWKDLKPKFLAAMKYCDLMGWRFKILTEIEIRSQYLDNVKFLRGYISTDYVHLDDVEVLMVKVAEKGETSPKKLLDELGVTENQRNYLLYALWHMVANFMVYVDLSEKLTMNTLIHSLHD